MGNVFRHFQFLHPPIGEQEVAQNEVPAVQDLEGSGQANHQNPSAQEVLTDQERLAGQDRAAHGQANQGSLAAQADLATQEELAAQDSSSFAFSSSQVPQAWPSYISEDICSICRETIRNRSCVSGCFHSFCFECIMEWAFRRSTCPLCRRHFDSIFRELGFYRYEIHNVELYRQERAQRIAAERRQRDPSRHQPHTPASSGQGGGQVRALESVQSLPQSQDANVHAGAQELIQRRSQSWDLNGRRQSLPTQGSSSPAASTSQMPAPTLLDISDNTCPICRDTISNLACASRCWHCFCFPCIWEWIQTNSTCPVCHIHFRYIFRQLGPQQYEMHDVEAFRREQVQRNALERGQQHPVGHLPQGPDIWDQDGGPTGSQESRSHPSHRWNIDGNADAQERVERSLLQQLGRHAGAHGTPTWRRFSGHIGTIERVQSWTPLRQLDGHIEAQEAVRSSPPAPSLYGHSGAQERVRSRSPLRQLDGHAAAQEGVPERSQRLDLRGRRQAQHSPGSREQQQTTARGAAPLQGRSARPDRDRPASSGRSERQRRARRNSSRQQQGRRGQSRGRSRSPRRQPAQRDQRRRGRRSEDRAPSPEDNILAPSRRRERRQRGALSSSGAQRAARSRSRQRSQSRAGRRAR